ncbi:Erythrocyte band 7 integral membrane protein [Anabarilius grahami]|uniref:Erythrocyte band 7 integral membrane protein n=1 Tax=Anabarilius grahami TaxID=495550 RepID=A0A3N0YMQ3_ANAGA|nr:Erythrocyte band 7 integral membrane protein [Anabarilius grahami]
MFSSPRADTSSRRSLALINTLVSTRDTLALLRRPYRAASFFNRFSPSHIRLSFNIRCLDIDGKIMSDLLLCFIYASSRENSCVGPRSSAIDRELISLEETALENTDSDIGLCGWILVLFSILLTLLTLPLSIWMCIKVLTKDSVTVSVDGVVYYRVQNATLAVANITNADAATRLLAQTTLRNVLGTKNLSEILSDREEIAHSMQSSLDDATDDWGIKVERVEIKDVKLPLQLQRAMAAEAEASREARAKVIAAEGEMNASRALKEASLVIAESPSALQLRYLQTLNTIAAEKNSTIIFPLPIDMMQSFLKH